MDKRVAEEKWLLFVPDRTLYTYIYNACLESIAKLISVLGATEER